MTSTALNKAFFLSKIFGCFPFSLKDGEIITDYRYLAYSITLKLFFAPQPIINIFQASFIMTRTKVHLTTATVSFIFATLFSYISFFNYFRNKRNLVRVLKRYLGANAGFRSLGEQPFDSVSLYSDCLLLAIGPCLTSIRYYVTPKMTWYMVYQLAYLINVMVSLYMLVQPFIRIVENLTIRMKRLRIILHQLCESTASQKRTYQLASVIRLYDLLCSTCDALNDIFSYNLLFVIFMVFCLITTYVYNSITSAFNSYAVALISGVVVIFYGVTMCRIAIHSERIAKEANEFNNFLFKLMIKDKIKDVHNNKKLRLHILMKRGVELTACGLFPLDHAIIHSMIAAATTYLVILEDFGKQ
ncbi:Gustatory receptor 77 [Halyomorpha halys]|nr:Gustatory receptor 77 [Halyomorpha halys]